MNKSLDRKPLLPWSDPLGWIDPLDREKDQVLGGVAAGSETWVCAAAATLGRRAKLRLAGTLPSTDARLRAIDRNASGLALASFWNGTEISSRIELKHAAERHKDRSHAEHGNEGFRVAKRLLSKSGTYSRPAPL